MRFLLLTLFVSFNAQGNVLCHLEFIGKVDKKLIERAYNFAKRAHRGVMRKYEKVPYITHPDRVSMATIEFGADQNKIIAALLHDVVEDSNVSISQIRRRFGEDVANIVQDLTSDANQIAQVGKTQYLIHKLNTISDDALLIKLLDRRDNLRDFSYAPKEFILKYKTSTEQILAGLDRKLNRQHQSLIREMKLNSQN
jgi:guanosine-3',5'-bis(diphosphate) 3'-pyrophosphohydrolase